MIKRWLLSVFLLIVVTTSGAYAQSPTPPAPLAPLSPAGVLTGDSPLYTAASTASASRPLTQGTTLMGVLARDADGWLWVMTSDSLGWLPPNAPLSLAIGLDNVPLLPREEQRSTAQATDTPLPATPTALPGVTLTPEPVVTPTLAVTVTQSASLDPLPWETIGLQTLAGIGLLSLIALLVNTLTLRRRLHAEQTHRQTIEAQLRDLTLSSSEAVILTDLAGSILEATEPASQITGQTSLAGRSLNEIFSQDTGPLLEETLVMGHATRDAVNLTADTTRPLSLEARTLTRRGRQVVRLLLREAPRPASEEELLTRRHDIALYDITTTISRSLDRDKVLVTALDRLMRLAGAEAGAIILRNGVARLWAAQGLSVAFTRAIEGIAPDRGLMGQVLHSATPWLLPHLPVSPDTLAQALAAEGIASLAVVPLLAHGEEAGVILLGSRRPRAFAPRDVPLFEVIGAHVGVAVENARLFREVGENIRSLENIKRFSESVFQNMSNGVITLDAGARVTSFNHAAEQMLKVSMATAMTHPLAQALDIPSSLTDMVQHVLRLGTTFAGHEIIIHRSDTQAVPLRLSIAPLRDDKSQIIGAVLVFDDLSEQRAMEEERQRLDRLALLGEMTAVIAHELRNPLASISSGIQYLLQQTSLNDPSREPLNLIFKESGRLNQLLEDILEMSRTPRIKLTEHSVTDILDDVLTRLQATAALHQVRIICDYDSNTPTIRCDPLRIDQAVSNLLINAIQAMPEGGTLTIRTWGETGAVNGSNGARHYELIVEIRDTGPGIPASIMPRLFSPFFTTKDSGTGLGLTITQRIISEHGGEVTVRSAEGQGATFMIRLPVSD